jgi:hypothetical protein
MNDQWLRTETSRSYQTWHAVHDHQVREDPRWAGVSVMVLIVKIESELVTLAFCCIRRTASLTGLTKWVELFQFWCVFAPGTLPILCFFRGDWFHVFCCLVTEAVPTASNKLYYVRTHIRTYVSIQTSIP